MHKHFNVYGTNPDFGSATFMVAMLSCLNNLCPQKVN